MQAVSRPPAGRARRTSLALGALLLGGAALVAAGRADAQPAPSRWDASLAAFAAADKSGMPPADGVLFVGSSTIRMWTKLHEDFRQQPVIINRGFGGSTLADCQHFVRQLVLQYRPRQVMLYAGDNDLAEGRTPAQVRDSLEAFVKSVRSELPSTRIAYISIKPSPLRAKLLPAAREANARAREYLATVPNTQYIDIFTPMLDADGQPRAELYAADRLHLNDAGYRLWQAVIGIYLPDVPPQAVPQVASAQPAATGLAGPVSAPPARQQGAMLQTVAR
jgi:lysophospholipase L1-like esterase